MATQSSSEDQREALLRASQPPPASLFAKLITSNHILHHQSVVDAYGHISVRNPQNPATFFLSRDRAPALVAGRGDVQEYRVADASPVDPDAPKGYLERFIHSELYKRYPGVHSVVHAHAEATLSFGVGSVPLRPVWHMGGGMGSGIVPVFDIARHYRSTDNVHNLLVTNEHLGAALAAGFSPESMFAKTTSALKNLVVSSGAQQTADFPASPVVLMRGHGFTCVGASIEEAVIRASHTVSNARVQTTALLMQGAYNVGLVGERFGGGEKATGPAKYEDITYLSEKESKDCGTLHGTASRPWDLWMAEVRQVPLYKNELADPPY